MLRYFTRHRFSLFDCLVFGLAGEALSLGHWIIVLVLLFSGSQVSLYLERRYRTKKVNG